MTTLRLEKRRRVRGELRSRVAADLAKRYDAGATIRELCEETGRSYGWVWKILSDTGVQLRGRGHRIGRGR